ncbi:WhiB family transcriptional regulator [Streptomyces sp. XC 2026]|uniref:WhiB family transcriptional regulator n=1 Tax=Streptomyces sp. XC 2026 TaxID=2782004 RepID=UPI0019076BC8|nr:WhiB family transcriptional regulator [Streptomyces sp. XC 2026]QQN79763.1 WhiB family transcriptional regulator [Streptomyces sp. XC 2026]QQN80629.1 WhiB family transcriptional regulator [Streptomyces sp. XC 2026]
MTTANWTLHAACAEYDQPDIWFLEGSREGRAAAAICRRQCPVALACLNAALEEETGVPAAHRFGIRGGYLPEERHRIQTGQHTRALAA